MQEFWHDWRFFLLPFIIGLTAFVVIFSLLSHDMNITSEHWYHIMYRGDTCDSLAFDKSFEIRKIFKDDIELQVIDHYLKVKNC